MTVPTDIAGWRDAATEWAFTAGWSIAKRLPERAARAMFQTAADQMWRRRGPSVVQYERNLARVNGSWSPADLRELSQIGVRSYLRYWCEAFRLPSWSPARVSSTFDLINKESADDAISAGTGVILVPGHSANWDHAGAWACIRYGGITTVAERLKPAGLFNQFLAYRQTLGMDVVPTGEPDIVRRLISSAKGNRLLALMGDRDISRNGVEVSFFGQPANFPGGPALIGLLSGAPVHPVTMWYDGENNVGFLHPAVTAAPGLPRAAQVASMTQQIATVLESGVREHPTDWHMMQPVWTADLETSRRGGGPS